MTHPRFSVERQIALMSNEQFIADVYWWAEHLPGPPTPWLDGLKRLLTEAADRLAVPPEGVRPPQQIDLPEEAAKVLRENLWELYGGQAAEGAQGWRAYVQHKGGCRGIYKPEHVCGLSGYNPMIDPRCPGCFEPQTRVGCTCGLDALLLADPPAREETP